MTLEGAINLNETADYIIYAMNSVTTGQYGVVVPKNINGTLNMLVDLHMKGSFDGVNNGSKTKEQLVNDISEEYNKLKTKYADGMLVMPMIDEAVFQTTVANGDKQKMFDEVKKIGAITSELYKKLTDSGIDKQKIEQKIIIVEKNQEDEKFVAWLKEQMPNFVDGILYSELNGTQSGVNPFVDGGNIFGPVQAEESKVAEPIVATPVSSGIFDNVAPVENVAPVTPVMETPVNPIAASNVDIFGTPASAPVTQNTAVTNEPVANAAVAPETPAVVNSTPVVEGPKPVESAMLEGTIAFTPIPNHPNNPTTNVAGNNNEENVNPTDKGSKGFANLLILLFVLVGVTIVSIELGKFLYSVYGA